MVNRLAAVPNVDVLIVLAVLRLVNIPDDGEPAVPIRDPPIPLVIRRLPLLPYDDDDDDDPFVDTTCLAARVASVHCASNCFSFEAIFRQLKAAPILLSCLDTRVSADDDIVDDRPHSRHTPSAAAAVAAVAVALSGTFFGGGVVVVLGTPTSTMSTRHLLTSCNSDESVTST